MLRSIQTTQIERLLCETDMVSVLRFASGIAEHKDMFIMPEDVRVTRAVLKHYSMKVRDPEDETVEDAVHLDWNRLLELYGDTDKVASCVDALRNAGGESDDELVDAAERYLTGERDAPDILTVWSYKMSSHD